MKTADEKKCDFEDSLQKRKQEPVCQRDENWQKGMCLKSSR